MPSDQSVPELLHRRAVERKPRYLLIEFLAEHEDMRERVLRMQGSLMGDTFGAILEGEMRS